MDLQRYPVHADGTERKLLPPTLDRLEAVDRLTVAYAGTPTARALRICDEHGGAGAGWTIEAIRDPAISKTEYATRLAEALFGIDDPDPADVRWDAIQEAHADFTSGGHALSGGLADALSGWIKSLQRPTGGDPTTGKA